MNRTDYSSDAELLDVEVYDYSTNNIHETGINSGRMRLPERYDIQKYYARLKTKPERGNWKRKKEDIGFSDDFKWQITYSFPDVVRENRTSEGTYGARQMTFRRLYLILCEHFNGGVYFIDTYFNEIYPHTIKKDIDSRLDVIKKELLDFASESLYGAVADENGKFARGYRENYGMARKLREYKAFAQAWEDNEGEYLAKLIKDDIIGCLMSGQIPLMMSSLSSETQKERIRAGLSGNTVFFATAQLIESLQLFVKIGGTGTWRTQQGIQV